MNIGPDSTVLVESFVAPIANQRKKTHFELVTGAIRWFMRGSGGRTDSYSVKAGIASTRMNGTDVIIAFDETGFMGLVREGTMTVEGPSNSVELKPGDIALALLDDKSHMIFAGPWNAISENQWDEVLSIIEIPLPQ